MFRKNIDFLSYLMFNKIPDTPAELRIEITNRCNLNCKFCDRAAMKRSTTDMSLDLFTKICFESVEMGIQKLGLNRFGEPTMHPQLPEMVSIAKKLGAINIEFATNATLLTEDLAEKLIDAGLDRIEFSIDSMNPRLYNKLRVGADFPQTHKNILGFLKIAKAKNSSIKTAVTFICMKENSSEIKDYFKYWKGLVDDIIFYPFHGYGNLINRHAIGVSDNTRVKCYLFYYMMSVYVDGYAGMCCVGDPDAKLATLDLNTHTLREAWSCQRANQIRGLHFKRDFRGLDICSKCDMTLPYRNWFYHTVWVAMKKYF